MTVVGDGQKANPFSQTVCGLARPFEKRDHQQCSDRQKEDLRDRGLNVHRSVIFLALLLGLGSSSLLTNPGAHTVLKSMGGTWDIVLE